MSEENTSEHSYRFAYGVGATNVWSTQTWHDNRSLPRIG